MTMRVAATTTTGDPPLGIAGPRRQVDSGVVHRQDLVITLRPCMAVQQCSLFITPSPRQWRPIPAGKATVLARRQPPLR